MLDQLINDKKSIFIKEETAKIKNLSPQSFETYIAELFKSLGFDVEQTPPTNDGGKDVVLKKDDKSFYVECKHYTDGAVGREIIQKAVGACVVDGASGCFVVTSSHFNINAINCIKNSSIVHLLDLHDIAVLACYVKHPDIFADTTTITTAKHPNQDTRTSFEIYKDAFNKAYREYFLHHIMQTACWRKIGSFRIDTNNIVLFCYENKKIAILPVQHLNGNYPICTTTERIIVAYNDYVYAYVKRGTDLTTADLSVIASNTSYMQLAELLKKVESNKITHW